MVVRKNSPRTKRASVPSLDVVVVNITEFKATNPNAAFMHDEDVQKLYIEYSFLDVPEQELETPFALAKPSGVGESMVFNFRKVIPVDRGEHGSRRRLLSKMLESKTPRGSKITFRVVSESEDRDCEDVGLAEIDLKNILKTGSDLLDCVIDVYPVEEGEDEPIGTLTVSILAKEVFKSLQSR